MNDNDRRETDDREIGLLLRAAGRREQLPPQLGQRWEAHFRRELQSVRAARRRRRQLQGAAAALLVVAVSLLLWLPGREMPTPPAVRVVAVTGAVQAAVGDGPA